RAGRDASVRGISAATTRALQLPRAARVFVASPAAAGRRNRPTPPAPAAPAAASAVPAARRKTGASASGNPAPARQFQCDDCDNRGQPRAEETRIELEVTAIGVAQDRLPFQAVDGPADFQQFAAVVGGERATSGHLGNSLIDLPGLSPIADDVGFGI